MSDNNSNQIEQMEKELLEKDKRIEKQSETIQKLKDDMRILKDENEYLNKRVENLQKNLIQFMSKEETISKLEKDRFKIKVVLLGENAVGKTSFIKRFALKKFESKYSPTIGAEITKVRLKFQQKIFDLMVWDLAGQILFENIAKKFIHGSDLAILIFDITRMDSFKSMRNWNNHVTKILGKKIPSLLIGNKSDLENDRKIYVKDALKLATDLDIPFIETSAKDDVNIQDALIMLLTEFISPTSE